MPCACNALSYSEQTTGRSSCPRTTWNQIYRAIVPDMLHPLKPANPLFEQLLQHIREVHRANAA